MYFFVAAYSICVLLYLPALGGQPIWDDLAYWFHNPEMTLSYFTIWTNFLWPFSVSLQKLLLSIFGDHFWMYHSLSLALHFVNSYLVYLLARAISWPHARWIFLLFLFHPACVIAVAWMIQIKTLLCFLLGFSAVLLFLKRKPKATLAGAVFYVFSILSKAASLPLMAIIAFLKRSWSRKAKIAFAIIFVCAVLSATLVISRNSDVEAVTVRAPNRVVLALLATRYYVEQSILPLNGAPIKGRSPVGLGFADLVFWTVIAASVFVFRKRLLYFGFGILMLLPYLGFVKTPFMTMTWVSDQHLYLALPFLLASYVMLLEKLPKSKWILAFLVALFAAKTAHDSRYFASQDNFYRASLHSDPGNVAVAFNYANTLAHEDRTDEALHITETVHELAKKDSHVANNPDLPTLENLRQQLLEFREFKKKEN